MKKPIVKNSKTSSALPEKTRATLAKTRPTKTALKRAIEKSIKKNKATLTILSKR